MGKFNEWLQNRDPELHESMVGDMWRHLQMNPDTGAMPEDEGKEHLLDNELKASMMSLPFDQGFQLFKKAWMDLHPGKQWAPGELKIAYKRMLKRVGKEQQGIRHDIKALHQQQQDRLAGKVYP